MKTPSPKQIIQERNLKIKQREFFLAKLCGVKDVDIKSHYNVSKLDIKEAMKKNKCCLDVENIDLELQNSSVEDIEENFHYHIIGGGANIDDLTRCFKQCNEPISDSLTKKYKHKFTRTMLEGVIAKECQPYCSPLLEFYKQTRDNTDLNFAHFFLSFALGEKFDLDKRIYYYGKDSAFDFIKNAVYQPKADEIIKSTDLNKHMLNRNSNYDKFIDKVLSPLNAQEIVEDIFTERLFDVYRSEANLSLDNVFSFVEDDIVRRVENDGFIWTKLKKDILKKILYTMPQNSTDVSKERYNKAIDILKDRYGLYEYSQSKTLAKLGEKYGKSKSEIRRREEYGFSYLRHHSRSDYIKKFLWGLKTDSDIKSVEGFKGFLKKM